MTHACSALVTKKVARDQGGHRYDAATRPRAVRDPRHSPAGPRAAPPVEVEGHVPHVPALAPRLTLPPTPPHHPTPQGAIARSRTARAGGDRSGARTPRPRRYDTRGQASVRIGPRPPGGHGPSRRVWCARQRRVLLYVIGCTRVQPRASAAVGVIFTRRRVQTTRRRRMRTAL